MVKRSGRIRRSSKATPRTSASARPPSRSASASESTGAPGADSAFPVVGIGASAGGLDAFKRLFGAMPADSGMAFVLVPHLDPTHESLMVELLAKRTAMTVREARDGTSVLPNHVYVIPPNADLAINDRVLRIVAPPPHRGSQTAIDTFLRSLAADQKTRAIGIVLSGTGSHGTRGLAAIKAAGGMVMAQSPESAEHDQMPRSAVAAGVVDQVLPPERMPEALARHAAQLSAPAASLAPEDLSPILLLLRSQMKRDFRGYRPNMLLRRVKRRMGLCRVERVAGYVEYLRAHPDEVQALGRDLSIAVTAFFREPDAFHVLERVVIPDLIERGGPGGEREQPVRVWVPGCATGEEAYSVAMLFLEHFALAKRPANLQIFATDIDDESLEIARVGLYPSSIAHDVSADRLRQFFVRADAHRYQVSQALREVITFAPQNLLSDAPFSKLHLIACRNVLIYLQPDVQAKVLALFHFALVDAGYLLLGPAESIGPATDRFEPVSRKWRVYRRTGVGRCDAVDIPILPVQAPGKRVLRRDERPRPAAVVADLLHRALLADFAPAAVLINRRYEILSVQGPVVDYLEFPPGELTKDLLALARPGLRTAIRGACQRATQQHSAAIDENARVKRQGRYTSCTVTARPIADPTVVDGLLLVTFEDRRVPRSAGLKKPARAAAPRRADQTLVRQLEHELEATRADLQGTIDELETANEELKASHEEVMSMNEELQSTNEEMETSKEELQSLNEELSTVNSQLQDKVRELDTANNDLVNLLTNTDIATVFLDADLRIRRFTPPTVKLLNLLPTDLGRPFRDIAPRITDPHLLEDCRRVIEKLAPVETVVQADHTAAYLRRVLPYRTADNRIDGIVITWVDVTRRLAAEAESRHLTAVLRDSNDAVSLLDLEGRITGWNRGAEQLYGYTEDEARTMHLRDLASGPQADDMGALISRIARGDVASESVDTQRKTKDGRVRSVSATMTLLRDSAGRPAAIVSTERDVTDVRELSAASFQARISQELVEHLPAGAIYVESGQIRMNQATEAITGFAAHELATLDDWFHRLYGEREAEIRKIYDADRKAGFPRQTQPLAVTTKGGEERFVQFAAHRLSETAEVWLLQDVTERRQAEQALRDSEAFLRSIVDTAADAIITIDELGTIGTFNRAAERMFGYTASEVAGRNVRHLMPPPYRDEHDGYIARYMKTGEARVIGIGREVFGLRKDGTTFPLDLAVSEIDHLRRFTGILRDLSDRRRLESRLSEAQVEERRHMARELHDEIGGHMTGVGLMAQTLHADLVEAASPLAARTEELLRSINGVHQRLRAVVRGLMPVEAIPEGLMAALDQLAHQCRTAFGIPCRFRCEPAVYVEDPTVSLHLFRIAQEAVSNAVRHAKPTDITITLERTPRGLEIQVIDDGSGTEEISPGPPGIGLESMRQRAHQLGGECSIRPREGGGTIVRCWVPHSGQWVSDARMPIVVPPPTTKWTIK